LPPACRDAAWPDPHAGVRVGIDATAWTNRRGFGRHVRALVSALIRVDPETRYTTVVDSTAAGDAVPRGADVRLVRTRRPTTEAAAASSRRSLRDLAAVSRALSDPAFDVLLYPNVYSFVPAWSRARTLVGIHDVTAERFPALALDGPRARLLWRLKVALARRQADALFTVSEFSRRAIAERFGLAPEDVFVAGVGVDPAFRVLPRPEPTPALRARGLVGGGRLVVHVGGFSPHKRLDLLVDVFADLAPRVPDCRLVLVGDYEHDGFHTSYPAIRDRVARLGLADAVSFAGFLPDDDLAVLLNRATVLVLPSMNEGFGLPALEAAACGCPAIVTRASPLPDALGAAALAVGPGDREALARALARVLGDEALRARMRAAAPAAAAAHTWERGARQVASAIRAVVRG
jgi:glycosyltransferase involved in cell wall biosynthesis